MTRKAQLTVFFCLSGLCLLSSQAIAQKERTIHGQLQGTDLKPSPGVKITSQKLGTTSVTKVSGEFIIKVSDPTDSLVVRIPGGSPAKVGVSATDQMMMITIQKDGTLQVLGAKPKDTAAAAGAAAIPASGAAETAALPRNDSARKTALGAAGTGTVTTSVDSAKTTDTTKGAAVATVSSTPSTTTSGAAPTATTTNSAAADATKPDMSAVLGTSGMAAASDTTHPTKGKDTTIKGPVIKGPTVTGIVNGPGNVPLDSVRVTTDAGKSFLGQNDGTFTAPFTKGSYLLISRPGYETVRVLLTTAGTTLHVKLTKSKTKEIQEVTVTALGITQKTRAVAYAITEAKGEEVQIAKTTNFTDALQGKLAGVNISTNSGSMGGSTEVTMRGNKSITGSNDALYVVDGVFMSNTNTNSYSTQIGGGGYDYGSPIQDVNPDDIQEVSVLKGAAATALYGSRGQNGVILVTTKKGGAHKLGIDYNLNVEGQKVYILPSYQNEYGGGNSATFDTLWYNGNQQYFKNAPTYTDPAQGGYDLLPDYAVDESWGPALNGQIIRPYYSFDADKGNPYFGQTATWSPQPNNVKDFFTTGVTVNNNVAISGGDANATYRLSYGNMSQTFVLPNSHQERNNVAFNGTYKINPWLTGVVSGSYINNNALGRPGTGFTGENPMLNLVMYGQRQLNINYMKIFKNPDGTQLDWNRTSYSNPAPAGDDNIYWNRWMEPETDSRNRVFGQAGFDIRVNSWINVSTRVFMDEYNVLQEERTAKDYYAGSYNRNNLSWQELDYQVLATAKKTLGKDFDLNASLGGNVEQQNNTIDSWTTAPGSGLALPGIYTLANLTAPPIYNGDIIRKQINSAFGMVTLGYKDMLFLDLTGRNDWSSALPPGRNSYFYPSVAASWVFSDLVKQSWLSFGKLRTSWAQIGNDLPPYNVYQTYQAPGLFGTNSTEAVSASLANPNLKPERSTEFEEGLEARFLKSRIGFDLAWYNRVTKDLIIPIQLSPTSGYTTFYANAATVLNRGIELQFDVKPLDFKNFSWDIAVNFARNHNEVTAINVPNNPTQDRVVIGTERRLNSVSVAAIKGQPLFALTGTDYTYLNGKRVVDSASGLYVPSAAGQVIGKTVPDFTGGVTNTFRYKDFTLSVLVDFQKGGDFFSYTNLYGEYSGTLAVTAANNIRQTGIVAPGVYADGTPNTTNLTAENYFQADQGKLVNKANMYDASYIYLREVRLGYNLPRAWAARIRADNLRLSLYGRNLWLIKSNAPNVDPSSIINSDSNIQGLEGGALPSVRSLGVNLNVGF